MMRRIGSNLFLFLHNNYVVLHVADLQDRLLLEAPLVLLAMLVDVFDAGTQLPLTFLVRQPVARMMYLLPNPPIAAVQSSRFFMRVTSFPSRTHCCASRYW